jgi:hypothetical protein
MPHKDPEDPQAPTLRLAEKIRARNRANYLKHGEKIRARNRANYIANREKRLAQMAEYQRSHPEVFKRSTAKWLEKYPEQRRIGQAAYQQKNSQQIYSKKVARQKANPEKARTISERRRARKLGLPDTWTHEQHRFMLAYWQHTCAACGAQEGFFWKLSIDHWIPLSSSQCPGTIATNLVPLCSGKTGCNTTKCNKDPKEWLIHRFGKAKAAKILKAVATYFAEVHRRFPTITDTAAD